MMGLTEEIKEKINAKYEGEYGKDVSRIAEICGQLIGKGDMIGLRWVFECLRTIEIESLRQSGVNSNDRKYH